MLHALALEYDPRKHITYLLERALRGEARREGWKQVCAVMQIAK